LPYTTSIQLHYAPRTPAFSNANCRPAI